MPLWRVSYIHKYVIRFGYFLLLTCLTSIRLLRQQTESRRAEENCCFSHMGKQTFRKKSSTVSGFGRRCCREGILERRTVTPISHPNPLGRDSGNSLLKERHSPSSLRPSQEPQGPREASPRRSGAEPAPGASLQKVQCSYLREGTTRSGPGSDAFKCQSAPVMQSCALLCKAKRGHFQIRPNPRRSGVSRPHWKQIFPYSAPQRFLLEPLSSAWASSSHV